MSDTRGFDLVKGVALAAIVEDSPQRGHVGAAEVVVIRRGQNVIVLDGHCTHLGAPLADGLLVGDGLRCPWHLACFNTNNGEAIEAPAYDPLRRWTVAIVDGTVTATEPPPRPAPTGKQKVEKLPFVIIGGGAAGYAAARALRAGGYDGSLIMVCAEADAPYDRTLLTKDYLDGSLGEGGTAIARTSLDDLDVAFRSKTRVMHVDPARRQIALENAGILAFAKVLLATGAEPVRPDFADADLPMVTSLRSLADCRAIVAQCEKGRHAVVVGGSFIALEAAASLRDRGMEVTLVAPEQKPLARIFGDAVADQLRAVHIKHGNRFLCGRKVARAEVGGVVLDNGDAIACDLVVAGLGVKPRLELARTAGLDVGDGVEVDAMLRSSHPDIFAAGDIANWPDPHSGSRMRVEHWVVAARQGQIAAGNMLDAAAPFEDVPFFWTKHFNFSVHYIGHAQGWDSIKVDGDVAQSDATLRFFKEGRLQAAAYVGRDLECLRERQRMMAALAR